MKTIICLVCFILISSIAFISIVSADNGAGKVTGSFSITAKSIDETNKTYEQDIQTQKQQESKNKLVKAIKDFFKNLFGLFRK